MLLPLLALIAVPGALVYLLGFKINEGMILP
jgi:hypothetical protein